VNRFFADAISGFMYSKEAGLVTLNFGDVEDGKFKPSFNVTMTRQSAIDMGKLLLQLEDEERKQDSGKPSGDVKEDALLPLEDADQAGETAAKRRGGRRKPSAKVER